MDKLTSKREGYLSKSFMGFLRRVERSKADLSRPPFASLVDAMKAGAVVDVERPIPSVLLACAFAQIAPSVVVADAVDVVNIPDRPATRHVKPSQSVSEITLAKNVDSEISARPVESWLWPSSPDTYQPSPFAGVRVIADVLAQARVVDYIFRSHLCCSDQQAWSGAAGGREPPAAPLG